MPWLHSPSGAARQFNGARVGFAVVARGKLYAGGARLSGLFPRLIYQPQGAQYQKRRDKQEASDHFRSSF